MRLGIVSRHLKNGTAVPYIRDSAVRESARRTLARERKDTITQTNGRSPPFVCLPICLRLANVAISVAGGIGLTHTRICERLPHCDDWWMYADLGFSCMHGHIPSETITQCPRLGTSAQWHSAPTTPLEQCKISRVIRYYV